uniref:RepB-like DNA primase domain-containing protein n=1 Tax=uncultured prokaryote TaxID=198431 RepID=A0A0H5Q351_9ZZZZ|nr:hypothetical protein [uncultured prokaryote]
MAYTKDFLDSLRKICVGDVFAALGIDPVQTRGGKPVKTAFDACFCAGMTYVEAQDFLANHFSDFLEADTVRKRAAKMVEGRSFTSSRIKSIAQEIALFMAALGVDALTVETNISESLKQTDDIYNFFQEGMSFDSISKRLNILAKLSMSGKPGVAPVGIYCQPIYPDDKIGIMIDDVHGDIIERYKPTVLLQTSVQGKPQAFYVVNRKYKLSFYNYVASKLNEKYGDIAVKSTSHSTRLPGFYNQKRAEPSQVKVLSYAIDSSQFEQFVETFMDDYTKDIEKNGYIISSDKPSFLGESDLRRIYKYIERFCAKENIDKREKKSIFAESLMRFNELYSRELNYVSYPEGLKEIGRRELTKLMLKYHGDDFDRSRADYHIARMLYMNGANIDEVYSYLIDNLLQKNMDINKVERIRSERELKRQAKRLAVKACPVWSMKV